MKIACTCACVALRRDEIDIFLALRFCNVSLHAPLVCANFCVNLSFASAQIIDERNLTIYRNFLTQDNPNQHQFKFTSFFYLVGLPPPP